MNKYSYDGPVKEFDKIVANNWHGETFAASEEKAKCNLSYQYKKTMGRTPNAKITLPGKLNMVG